MKLIEWLFGYCGMCRKWFIYPKRRRMNTQYLCEESNYCKVCSFCFEEVEEYWQERWD
jgi:hypothetical protein